jgi:hypothetical protein
LRGARVQYFARFFCRSPARVPQRQATIDTSRLRPQRQPATPASSIPLQATVAAWARRGARSRTVPALRHRLKLPPTTRALPSRARHRCGPRLGTTGLWLHTTVRIGKVVVACWGGSPRRGTRRQTHRNGVAVWNRVHPNRMWGTSTSRALRGANGTLSPPDTWCSRYVNRLHNHIRDGQSVAMRRIAFLGIAMCRGAVFLPCGDRAGGGVRTN